MHEEPAYHVSSAWRIVGFLILTDLMLGAILAMVIVYLAGM